ncbi:MAG: hypothetical protein ACYSTO_07540 [Planctomycetota bacterium]
MCSIYQTRGHPVHCCAKSTKPASSDIDHAAQSLDPLISEMLKEPYLLLAARLV